jgi:flagellar hook-basal body complex protein FliE
MNIYLGDPTLGLPVPNFTKGIGGVTMNKEGFGTTSTNVDKGESFGAMLMKSLNQLSTTQNEADKLGMQAIVNPNEVNAHEVTIALEKASMSLSVAKTVIDRSVTGFKEILNIR